MNGNGEFYFHNGNTYVGNFQDDQIHGQGVFSWKSSGEVYQGNFIQGKPGGNGKLTFKDGSSFTGSFEDGKPHGTGKYTYPEAFVSYNCIICCTTFNGDNLNLGWW